MPPSKNVTLALASFMDSPEAQALTRDLKLPEADVRKVVGRFLSVCYDDLGIEPKHLDGQDMHGALGHVLPGKFKRGEALADAVPDVLRAYLKHLEESEVLANAFELKQGFETTIDEFLVTVKTGKNPHGHGHHAPQEPFEHRAEKLGRNDPCSCGSGKKYKKCHGKNA
ncbi:MAG: SEC-C metal-binding domain-containing protein [Planctomycetota bacterium]